MAILGAMAIGIVIGFILSWIINTLMRSTVTDATTESRQREFDLELKRLRTENQRLLDRLEGRDAG